MKKVNRTDRGHGSPYDRGTADAYYQRPYNPHYFQGDTHQSYEFAQDEMSAIEIDEYTDGWNHQKKVGIFKEYA